MAFIPTVDTVLAELVYLWNGQVCENTLWFQASAGVDVENMELLGGALVTWWGGFYAPGVSEKTSLTSVKITDQSSSSSPVSVITAGLPLLGENTSPALPNNDTLHITFYTNARGRTSRGGNYVVGLCENQHEDSYVLEAVREYFTDGYSELIGAGALVTGWQWVVVSHQENKVPRVSGLARPVTSISIVDTVIDSQRRRLPGRGN